MSASLMQSSLHDTFTQLQHNLQASILGQPQLVERLLIALLSDGHLLVEGLPGLAKTRAVKALGDRIEGEFHRIQFTPDLLPSDVTGTDVFRPEDHSFVFQQGPIFHNLVLVDEVNRAPAKVQSALLEAMAERRVTVDGTTYDLEPPFLVIATQNPVDHEGTFPLPEAQLDRFLIRLSLGYPTAEQEAQLLDRLRTGHPLDILEPVVSVEDVVSCQQAIRAIEVHEKVRDYIVQLVHATREHEDVALGGSPRASIALIRTAQALAGIRGQSFVTPDEVKRMLRPVLGHRLILKAESRLRKVTYQDVLEEIVDRVPVPVMPEGGAA